MNSSAVLQTIELDKSGMDKGSRHRDEPICLTLMSMYKSIPSVCMHASLLVQKLRQFSSSKAAYAQASLE